MGLSIEELELETVEYLPAREVMSKCGRSSKRSHCWSCGGDDNDGVDQDYNGGYGSINILSGNQVGLNVLNLNG